MLKSSPTNSLKCPEKPLSYDCLYQTFRKHLIDKAKPLRAPKWVHCLFLPCFRKNVNVACKIMSFLCSFDHFLLKNVIAFSFIRKSNFKTALIWKNAILTYCLHFSLQRKDTKIQGTYPLYIHVFCSPYWLFCLPNFANIPNLSCMVSLWCDSFRIHHAWFLFGVTPFWCWFFSHHFRAINK